MKPEILSKVDAKFADLYDLIDNSFFSNSWRLYLFNRKLNINYNLRGTRAGTAWFRNREIRLNYQLLENNLEDFINGTVPHELAHLVAYAHYGTRIKPHGIEWRKVARFLGDDGERCHNYDVSRTKQDRNKYIYQCNCRENARDGNYNPITYFKEHEVGACVHKKIQSGLTYTCKKCKTPVLYTNKYLSP